MNVQLSGVTTEILPYLWESVEGFLRQALARSMGEYALEDIYDALLAKKMQLWIAATEDEVCGVVVTEIQQYPRKTVGTFLLVAGKELESWEFIGEEIERWMFSHGVDFVRNYGRLGWKKKVARLGYELSYCVFQKPLKVKHEDCH